MAQTLVSARVETHLDPLGREVSERRGCPRGPVSAQQTESLRHDACCEVILARLLSYRLCAVPWHFSRSRECWPRRRQRRSRKGPSGDSCEIPPEFQSREFRWKRRWETRFSPSGTAQTSFSALTPQAPKLTKRGATRPRPALYCPQASTDRCRPGSRPGRGSACESGY